MHAMQLSPVERCIIHSFGGTLPEFHAAFTPPPPHLRMACDHNDGSLLGWKYGEQPRCAFLYILSSTNCPIVLSKTCNSVLLNDTTVSNKLTGYGHSYKEGPDAPPDPGHVRIPIVLSKTCV